MSRRAVLTAAGLVATSTVVASRIALADDSTVSGGSAARAEANVEFYGWRTAPDWAKGKAEGVAVTSSDRAGILVDKPVDVVEYTDPHTGETSEWEIGVWTSPVRQLEFGASELIASWNVDTPAGSFLKIEMKGIYEDDTETPWYVMGVWASGEDDIIRTSVDDQSDDRSAINTDTFAIDEPDKHQLLSYQLRLTLHRKPGTDVTPTVWRAGAMCSFIPDRFEVPASEPGDAAGVELEVPRYSQMVHEGQYPEYGGGGEAWCSPTSSQMIIESFGRKASEEDLEWVDPDYADPQVCHAARYTFDTAYDGCGNWPFNTAYASTYEDMDAIVTRLNSLTEAETLIKAGFPIITSQSFMEEELEGAGYGTAGHLMTLVGFTEEGDVIANDPASKDNDAVRRVYKRRQFENIWLRTQRKDADGKVVGATGGVCYLYKPTDKEWPKLPGVGN
ncbi:MAG: peptidase C39 family protein [Stackebrandtia sp.]